MPKARSRRDPRRKTGLPELTVIEIGNAAYGLRRFARTQFINQFQKSHLSFTGDNKINFRTIPQRIFRHRSRMLSPHHKGCLRKGLSDLPDVMPDKRPLLRKHDGDAYDIRLGIN